MTTRILTAPETISALVAYCRDRRLVHEPRTTDDPVYLLTQAAGEDATLCQSTSGEITVVGGPWAGTYHGATPPELPAHPGVTSA